MLYFCNNIKKKAECDEEINLQQQKHDESDADKANKTPIGANHVTRIAGDILMDFSWGGLYFSLASYLQYCSDILEFFYSFNIQ